MGFQSIKVGFQAIVLITISKTTVIFINTIVGFPNKKDLPLFLGKKESLQVCFKALPTGEDVKQFKDNKCIKKMDTTMKAMKEFKLGKKGVGGCLNAFKACKAAQKAAPGYSIHFIHFTHFSLNSLLTGLRVLPISFKLVVAKDIPIKFSISD